MSNIIDFNKARVKKLSPKDFTPEEEDFVKHYIEVYKTPPDGYVIIKPDVVDRARKLVDGVEVDTSILLEDSNE